MREVVDFLANMAERKFRFLFFVLVIGLAGILYAHGLSWTTTFFSLIVLVVLASGWIAMAFWVSIFRSMSFDKMGQQQKDEL